MKHYLDYQTELQVREKKNGKALEGYFILFNEETHLYEDVHEVIRPEAIREEDLKSKDIKAFFNHDYDLVLGRTKNGTLELNKDEKGVYGVIHINEEDKQALDIYNRVKRGDINQCSFGFRPIKDNIIEKDDKKLIEVRELDLVEVSVVTYPAYEKTSVKAREKQVKEALKEIKEVIDEGNDTEEIIKEVTEILEKIKAYQEEGAEKPNKEDFRSVMERLLELRKEDDSDALIELEKQMREASLIVYDRYADSLRNPYKPKKIEQGDDTMNKIKQTRKALDNFIRTRGADTSGLKSDEVGTLIPEEVVYDESLEIDAGLDLSALSTVINVGTASGVFPLLKPNNDVMHSVEELKSNPELAKPQFDEVEWKVKTYRGALPISQEAIEDAIIDLTDLVLREGKRAKLNTVNKNVCDVYKSFEKKAAGSTDDLKDIINLEIPAGYEVKVVASRSFFNVIDKLKDENGRYILQPDATSPTGHSLFGYPIYKVEDEMLGAKGEANAFIGDTKRAVLVPNRRDLAVKWVDHDIYGTHLGLYSRHTAVQLDDEAGFLVTYTEGA